MRAGTRPHRIPQVALLIETSTGYGRGLLRGILLYSRLHGPWSLHVAPGHLDQALPKARSWRGTGIIGRISSPEMEKLILSTRLPFVASSLGESRSPIPGDKFGEIRTDSEGIARMAAAHLIEAGFRRFAFCGFASCHWSIVREKTFFQFSREGGYTCAAHRITRANWMQRPNWTRQKMGKGHQAAVPKILTEPGRGNSASACAIARRGGKQLLLSLPTHPGMTHKEM